MNSQSNPPFAGQTNEVFDVEGMDCSEEVAAIERAVKPIPGVLGVRAEIVSSKVTIFPTMAVRAAPTLLRR